MILNTITQRQEDINMEKGMVIKMIGGERISRILTNLGPKLNKAVLKAEGQWLKIVKKSAKIRAPHMTGELAESIVIKKGRKNWMLVVGSPYGRFQEMGFKGHLVSSSASTRNSLGTIGSAYGIPGKVPILIKSSPGKHFVRDAIQENMKKLLFYVDGNIKKDVIK